MIIDPDYARIFTKARIYADQYGYSCCVQGSTTRDLDLLIVPWTKQAVADDLLRIVNMIAASEKLVMVAPGSSNKPHGRLAWTLVFPEFNDPRWIDISGFPATVAQTN